MEKQDKMNKKVSTSRLSIISNCILLILKFVAGFWIGSISIISEAIHSGIDLFAAAIAFFAVKNLPGLRIMIIHMDMANMKTFQDLLSRS